MSDLLAITAELVEHSSVSFEEAAFVDWLESELRCLQHLEVFRVGDNLVARTELNRPQRLMLAGHTDTVPSSGNSVARIEGDVLWGLGASDMKSGLAVFLELARSVPEPAVDLTFVFYAREEVAQEHSGLGELVALDPDLLQADCAILGEPTAAGIEAGCQGALRVEVRLAGASAHTARPWMGRNAIHRLAPLLEALAAYEARAPLIDGCRFRESLQAVGVEGGMAGNVVPDQAVLRIHHRFAPDRDEAEAHEFLLGLLAPFVEDDDEIVVLDSTPACAPSLQHPLLQRLVNDNALSVEAKLGWTDVARLWRLGIPATNFGPGDPTLAHSADERVDRASIETVFEALRRLISD